MTAGLAIHEVGGSDLDAWDAAAVDVPGGHVFQSRAWGEFQARQGWRVRWLRFDDGFPALVLQRPWPWIGGASAYVSRGPIPSGTPEETADRQIAIARWLEARAVDVVAADPEVGAAGAFGDRIRSAGFRPIEELQPSRHRMRIPLHGVTEEAAFAAIARSTRQRIRRADVDEIHVGSVAPADGREPFDEFYDLLRATGERKGFTLGGREDYVGWWQIALSAGHLVYLRARPTTGAVGGGGPGEPETVAGLILYRHGGRISTVHSGDRAELRAAHPGVLHLLRWRALQLAITEGCSEMDLGGVDVAGARRIPAEGDPTFGLYEHKRSFGAEWVQLAGAHEHVARPLRYFGGRVAQRAASAGRALVRAASGERNDPTRRSRIVKLPRRT